jgi:hypothetical protein
LDETRATSGTPRKVLATLDDLFGRLNADPSRLCEATRGQPLRVMLRLPEPSPPARIVIMADGLIVHATDKGLLGEDFQPQLIFRGEAHELTDIVLGRRTLKQAIQEASLTPEDVNVDLVEAVRIIVRDACTQSP